MSLWESIRANNGQKVREEIVQGRLNKSDLCTALVEASEEGCLEIVQILIEAGVNVNIETIFGTPLGQAAFKGHLQVVQTLIEAGADVNYSEIISDNKSPLVLAAQEGHFEIVKLLVETGANVNKIIRESQEFALVMAAVGGHEEIFNYLAPLTDLKLRQEAEELLPEGILQRQREKTVDPFVSALLSAIFEQNLDKIREILANVADINGFSEYGSTALLTAAKIHRNISIVKMLLEEGADPNLADEDTGETPLMASIGVSENSSLISFLLISAGSDVNAKDKYGTTSMMIAGRFGNLTIIQQLIKSGADINIKDAEGKNVLDYVNCCFKSGFIDYIKYQKIIEILTKDDV